VIYYKNSKYDDTDVSDEDPLDAPQDQKDGGAGNPDKKEMNTFTHTFRVSGNTKTDKLKQAAINYWDIPGKNDDMRIYDSQNVELTGKFWTVQSKMVLKQSVFKLYNKQDNLDGIGEQEDKKGDSGDPGEKTVPFEAKFEKYFPNFKDTFFNVHEAIKNHEENAKESGDREAKMADDHLMYRMTIICLLMLRFYTTLVFYQETNSLVKGFSS
jgi:hypothetical protein